MYSRVSVLSQQGNRLDRERNGHILSRDCPEKRKACVEIVDEFLHDVEETKWKDERTQN